MGSREIPEAGGEKRSRVAEILFRSAEIGKPPSWRDQDEELRFLTGRPRLARKGWQLPGG